MSDAILQKGLLGLRCRLMSDTGSGREMTGTLMSLFFDQKAVYLEGFIVAAVLLDSGMMEISPLTQLRFEEIEDRHA